MPRNPRETVRPPVPGASRRQFITRSALAAGGVLVGPSLLAACGGDNSGSGSSGGNALRISNWPLYMAKGFNDSFTKATGLKVDYKENFQDNETWFAANKDALAAKQDIGADLVVPTDFMSGRLIGLKWLTEVDKSKVPNATNIRADLQERPADPGNKYSMPYMSGITGIAYNAKETGRPITSVADLWDPAFKGRVSMFSDMRDGLGMIMISQGTDPAKATEAAVQKAADAVAEQKAKGQIRRFTGNDYQDDLTNGNVVVAQVYSGDIAQLQPDNPDIQFVVPKDGATQFVDTMAIPYTSEDVEGALKWINFVYDKANYAKLLATVQYIPVLSDMTAALEAVDPKLAQNPLINPPKETFDLLTSWRLLTDKEDQKFSSIYANVTGG